MSDTKREYNLGLKALATAKDEMELAAKHFSISSYSLDNYPTARHEIMEISDLAEALRKKIESLHQRAYAERIR